MNKKILSFIAHFALAWFLCASPISAQIDIDVVSASIVRVRAYDNNKVAAEGSGFVVNDKGDVPERARKSVADSLRVAKAQADLAREATKKAKAKEEAAQQVAERAKARADSGSKAVASLKAAKAKADSLRAAEVRAQAKADSLKAAKEKAAQRLQWGIVGGVGLVLLALLGWLLFSRRKLVTALKNPRQLVQQMSRRVTKKEGIGAIAKGPKHGLVLAGFDGRGDRVRIELSPARFASQRLGISLGRHPDLVDEIVADAGVSRRHLRIAAEGDQFYVEDLNSSNGTFLNEQHLSPFKPARLDYGTKVALGDLVLVSSKL